MTSETPPAIDPYDAVLADLRAKREQIDQAILAIESLRGGASATTAAASASKKVNDDMSGPGALLGMSITDAAKKLLASHRRPLRNPDFAAMFKTGGLVLNSKEPANTIGSVLTRRFLEVGDVVRVDRGTWGLKEWYPGRTFKAAKADAKTSTSEPEQPFEPPTDEPQGSKTETEPSPQRGRPRVRERQP